MIQNQHKKSVSFLHIKNEHTEKAMRGKISFTITSKATKYVEINLVTEVKDLYNESEKTLRKETTRI
jgi:hypothetical protein